MGVQVKPVVTLGLLGEVVGEFIPGDVTISIKVVRLERLGRSYLFMSMYSKNSRRSSATKLSFWISVRDYSTKESISNPYLCTYV